MKQINNGYAEYYYLLEDGSLYNAANDKTVKLSKDYTYRIRTIDDKRKRISLKALYKLVYNKPYSRDNIEDLDGEIWKEIDDTNGLYYVSNKGRVKSLHGYNAAILKSFNNNGGYARVDLKESGKRQTKLVHRLVAAAFLPLPQKIDMQLHHKDFNKDNNAADNLEWLSPAVHAEKHKEYNKRSLEDDEGQSTKPESNNSK